jgi:hypothetical protein
MRRVLDAAASGIRFQYSPVAYMADWRLGVLHYLFLFAVFVYTLISILFLHQHCSFTSVSANTAAWFSSSRRADNVQSMPPYCNNASYDWVLTPAQISLVGNFVMHNISCHWLSDAVVLQSGATSMGITTNTFRLEENSGYLEPLFMVDIDHITANIQHVVNVPSGPQELNPPTTLYDWTGRAMKTFGNPGEVQFVSLSMADIFQAVGQGLADYNPQSSGMPPVRFRNSGMLVGVQFTYENAVPWRLGLSTRCKITMKVMKGNWSPLGWTTAGSTSFQRYGVGLVFSTEGQMGASSSTTLVTHLISMYVLAGMCSAVVLLVVKVIARLDKKFARSHRIDLPSASGHRRRNMRFRSWKGAKKKTEMKKKVSHVVTVDNPLSVTDVSD